MFVLSQMMSDYRGTWKLPEDQMRLIPSKILALPDVPPSVEVADAADDDQPTNRIQSMELSLSPSHNMRRRRKTFDVI